MYSLTTSSRSPSEISTSSASRPFRSRCLGQAPGEWLLTPEGFYSIVQKPGEERLCVRARDTADLDRLRERYMAALSETVETRGAYARSSTVSDDIPDSPPSAQIPY